MNTKPVLNHFLYSCLFLLLYHLVSAVDRNKFRTCDQTGFCRRLRSYQPESSPFKLDVNSINVSNTGVEGTILNTKTQVTFSFLLQFLVDSTIRLRINEEKVTRPRYQPLQALIAEPIQYSFDLEQQTKDFLAFKTGSIRVIMEVFPLKIKFFQGENLVLVANGLHRFEFEHHRPRPETTSEEENNDGLWSERYHDFTDTKPFGPMAIAMDFSFPEASHLYGLPSHADNLAMKSTAKTDPYRLYNLDVFEYELYETMSLYGAVPMVISHGVNSTNGVFWLNSAETWVDITTSSESKTNSNVMEKIVNLVAGSSSSQAKSGCNAYFMSETGIVDVFFMLGPGPYDVTRQYSRLTGTAPLPPIFALGYHQSRWNYIDQEDVKTVAENFDKYDIPLDVMWLDIEYTHDKKYFTWDPIKFSDPENMINVLATKGRKLVVIIDPHIKRDNGYSVHREATANGYYVKNKDRNDFEGWCWPGSTSYLDFLNPAAGEFYSTRYFPENFRGSTKDVYIWNDMNEPSVFNGPEVSMPKDCLHYGEWEHREIHNMYGMFQVMLTYDGILKRSGGKKRPFILTRSHFAGTQRYAAIWTGDNIADWEHLKMSVPMCLSSALGGISFCGADVGGFFRNPSEELLIRWYQTGTYLPFFRAHAHIETKRREPWLFEKNTMDNIRSAIRERQSLLPFWYTLFYEHTKTGAPVIRPLFMEFPKETETYEIDYEFLLGNSLLIRPVTEPDVSEVQVYFPGQNEIWYNKYTSEQVKTNGIKSVPVVLEKIPVFIRGGSIIPVRNRIRRSSLLTLNDPFTLIVALDINGTASGQLYIDDGDSFDYREGKYIHLQFSYLNNQLLSQFVDKTQFQTKAWVERVIIMGIPNLFRRAIITAASNGVQEELEVKYNTAEHLLTDRKSVV